MFFLSTAWSNGTSSQPSQNTWKQPSSFRQMEENYFKNLSLPLAIFDRRWGNVSKGQNNLS